jgi:hypothetical protein
MGFVTFSSEQDQFGYLAETVFGTPNADNAAFKTLKFPKGTKIEPFVALTDLELNRAARQSEAADIHLDNYSGPVKITVPAFLLDKTSAADLIFAWSQNKVSEGSTPNFAKVFKVNVAQPDFTANAGMFFTLAWKGPIASKHIKVSSCVVKEITIDLDKSGTGPQALVKVSLVIVGKKCTTGLNLTGTWIAAGTTYYNSFDFTFKFVTTALPWLKCTIKLDNGAKPLDMDSDGTPKSWDLQWGKQSVVSTHWYNAESSGSTVDAMADRVAGTLRAYSIGSSIAVGTDGNLLFAWYSKLDADPQGTDDKKMTVPLSHMLVHNSIATNDLIIVSISDGVDQSP